MSTSPWTAPAAPPTITIHGPVELPADLRGIHDSGAAFWPLAMARELDDALLHLRLNEPSIGLLVFRSAGDPAEVLAADACWSNTRPTGWCAKSACC